jgi:UrcA family protein
MGNLRVKAGVVAGVMGFMLLGAAVAQASPVPYVGPDVVVGYADLDITSAAGAEKLYERIQQAAARVCPQSDSGMLTAYAAVLRCRNTVLEHAVRSVSSPQVTAVFAARAHHWARSPV